jgi:hypothetical protein
VWIADHRVDAGGREQNGQNDLPGAHGPAATAARRAASPAGTPPA